MNSEHLIVLKNNREQIIDITKSILQSESSPEDIFVEGFVNIYIENFDKIGANNTDDHFSSEDIPFGIGAGELLLTSVLLPIIVNLVTELIKRKANNNELSKKIDEVEIVLKKHRIKNPKKLATEIVNKTSKSI